jgi:hypothetical protein
LIEINECREIDECAGNFPGKVVRLMLEQGCLKSIKAPPNLALGLFFRPAIRAGLPIGTAIADRLSNIYFLQVRAYKNESFPHEIQ